MICPVNFIILFIFLSEPLMYLLTADIFLFALYFIIIYTEPSKLIAGEEDPPI